MLHRISILFKNLHLHVLVFSKKEGNEVWLLPEQVYSSLSNAIFAKKAFVLHHKLNHSNKYHNTHRYCWIFRVCFFFFFLNSHSHFALLISRSKLRLSGDFFNSLVFRTSTASGMREEKVSLGITTLLSMSILMLMISDQMPTTSTFIPLIGSCLFEHIFLK